MSLFITRQGKRSMLQKKKKDSVIKSYKTHTTDTGSPQVQIAILTEEIRELATHLKKHKHDYSARRGLMRKIGSRRRLLVYLQREHLEEYDKLIKKLNLKRRLVEEEVILEDEEALIKPEEEEDTEKTGNQKSDEE